MTAQEKRAIGKTLVWTCPICGKPFTPQPGHRFARPQKTCLARACVVEQRRSHTVGVVPTEAILARKEHANARMYTVLRNAFGDLSAREQRLFRAVYRFAWDRGYQRGIHARRKQRAQEAA